MEKRILIFLLLSFAIIFSFDFILKELGLMPEPQPVEEGQEAFPRETRPCLPPAVQDASSEDSCPMAPNRDTLTLALSLKGEGTG